MEARRCRSEVQDWWRPGGAAVKCTRGPFEPGEPVLLIDRKSRRYLFDLGTGREFHTHTGVIAHDDIIGAPEGTRLRSTRGAAFLAVRPTLADAVLKMPRGAQVVYPKDTGAILVLADIFPGARVLEAGLGSGALSMALLRAGAVVSGYERREDFLARARANVERFCGPEVLERYRTELRDVYEGIDESGLDRVVLDLPEPWRVVPHAGQALRSGGILLAYTPSIVQVQRLRQALDDSPFDLPRDRRGAPARLACRGRRGTSQPSDGGPHRLSDGEPAHGFVRRLGRWRAAAAAVVVVVAASGVAVAVSAIWGGSTESAPDRLVSRPADSGPMPDPGPTSTRPPLDDPPDPGPVPDDHGLSEADLAAAVESSVRVSGPACRGIVREGSGFGVGDGDLVVTIAHLMIGMEEPEVELADGRTLAAVPVAFDPVNDLAVLRVADAALRPLPLSEAVPDGTVGAVLAWEAEGEPDPTPFRIDRPVTVRTETVNGDELIERPSWLLAADTEVGDSGAALVAEVDGRVTAVGVAWGASRRGGGGVAYATRSGALERLLALSDLDEPAELPGCG